MKKRNSEEETAFTLVGGSPAGTLREVAVTIDRIHDT